MRCWSTEVHYYKRDKYTDKKEIQIFLIYKEIQREAVAKS